MAISVSTHTLLMQIYLNVPLPQYHVEFPSRPIGDTAMRWDTQRTKVEIQESGYTRVDRCISRRN